ncbi:MAG: ATP-binding protein [Planctomycetia bacterium]|uniref:ATP-binding protein n=1 Tax=Candidatus Kuenenia TaxID=380738 RepID=UPI0002F9816F|nr:MULTISPECIES: ATP-binding protein [Kuenenia]MBE7549074.1 ATP-binding protein [Planctomycetia bacterium]MCZ7621894.1 ATP-binding protein [Candidatus Kuenenia sp.]
MQNRNCILFCMIIARKIKTLVQQRLKSYPAVALIGPRQSGKTTLARSLSTDYFDLEQEPEQLRLDVQWPSLIKTKRLIVLDEAQSWPELFPRLRGAIDMERQRLGRFLLLGSVSPALMKHVSESLAGRLSLVELTPLTLTELPDIPMTELWLRGGFPDGGVLTSDRYPQWQKDYLDLMTQRDLPSWGLSAKPQVMQRLLRMLAAVHGQLWNASQIGQSLGLSYHTVNTYVHFLEGTFLIRKLQPWFANVKKRLVRSPKCYWRDTGILHSLLGVQDYETLLNQPWVGASWEGFVIGQILDTLNMTGWPVDPWFFRTADGAEIDLMFRYKNKLWAIEVKLTSNPSLQDFDSLNRAADLVGADKRVLVSQTTQSAVGKMQISCSLQELLEMFVKPE